MAGRVPSVPTVDGKLAAGVYESLHTAGLDRQLADATGLTPRFSLVDAADAPEVLARHIASIVRRVLADERNHDRRSTLVGELLTVLAAAEEQPTETLEQLLVLTREVAPGVHELSAPGPWRPQASVIGDLCLGSTARQAPDNGGFPGCRPSGRRRC